MGKIANGQLTIGFAISFLRKPVQAKPLTVPGRKRIGQVQRADFANPTHNQASTRRRQGGYNSWPVWAGSRLLAKLARLTTLMQAAARTSDAKWGGWNGRE